MSTIDYTTLTFDQLREPYLRAEGWICEKDDTYFIMTKGAPHGGIGLPFNSEAEAWRRYPITVNMLLGPGGAMERAMKKRWVFAVGIYDDDENTLQCKFGDYTGYIRIVRGSDALCRAVMIAMIISHEQENTNG